MEHLRSLLAGDLSQVSDEELFRGIRESELVMVQARDWTGRLVAEVRRRDIPWSQIESATGKDKTTLDRRTQPPRE